MYKIVSAIFYIFKTFLLFNINGCNFLFRKIPYIGVFFIPFSILGVFSINRTHPERIRITFQKLGPTFIKLGQLLSTRPDIIGDELANELAILQDKLPPFSFCAVKKIIKQTFNINIVELFSEVNPNPVATASISQVHKAITKDGNIVALKVLRPGIRKKFSREVSSLYFIAYILNKFSKLKRLRLIDIIKTFEHSTKMELNLRLEAAAADQFKDNLIADHNIYVPKILWDITSERTLCTEWINGIKITDIKQLQNHNLDLKKISNNLVTCYFNQAYRDGFFHADMHPGNILITKEGKIAFIDFGIMGKLSEEDKIYVTQIIYGFVKRDYNYIAKIHHDAKYIPKETDLHSFALACRSVGEPLFGLSSNKISIAKMLAQLFQITEDYGMETQPQLLLLQKTLLIIEGVGSTLNPDLNMWELGEPWLSHWARKNLGFDAELKRNLTKFCKATQHIPEVVNNLSIIADNLSKRKASGKYIYITLGKNLIYITFGIAMGIMVMKL